MEKRLLIVSGLVLTLCLLTSVGVGAVQDSVTISLSGAIIHTQQTTPIFETSFEDAVKTTSPERFTFPNYPQYPSTSNGLVYGTAPGESWIETGFAHSGSKCAGFRRGATSDRIEWNVWSLDQWVGQEAFVSEWVFLPADFNIDNGWDCVVVLFSDGANGGCPYMELHLAKWSGGYQAYLAYRDVNGQYTQNPSVPITLPLGQWFPVQWHVKRATSNGLVEAWVNRQYPDQPTLTFTGATKGTEDYWYISPAKCYGNQVNLAGRTLWIDDLKIYRTLPS